MPVKLPSLGGGGGSSSSLLLDGINFPLTISKTQPTAIRAGHIWVDSDKDSKITNVKILETLNTGEANGTLMFIVGDLANHSLSFSNILKTTNGSSKTVSISNTTSTVASWSIMSETGDASSSLKVNNPIVYSKIDGLLEIETAYMWNGSSWISISQKGSYLAYVDSETTIKIQNYNASTNELTNNTSITIPGLGLQNVKFTRNGVYFIAGDKVYKKSGDVFTLYYSIPTYVNGYYGLVSKNSSLSEDGLILIIPQQNGATVGFVAMQNNGSTFVFKQYATIGSTATNTTAITVNACVSASGTSVLLSYPVSGSSGTYTGTAIDLFISTNGTFQSSGTRIDSFVGSSSSFQVKMTSCPFNDTLFAYQANDSYSSTSDSCCSLTVNLTSKTYTRTVLHSGTNYTYLTLGWIDNILIYYQYNYSSSVTSYVGKDIVTNTAYTITLDGVSSMNGFVMHSNNNRATSWNSSNTGNILQVTKSGTTITLKSLKSYTLYYYGVASMI